MIYRIIKISNVGQNVSLPEIPPYCVPNKCIVAFWKRTTFFQHPLFMQKETTKQIQTQL